MSKQKTKHQKHLKEIRDKKVERRIRFGPQPFSLWDFFRTFQLEFLAAVVIAGLLIAIPRWDSAMSKKENGPSAPTISEELKQSLLSKYPNGFKLIEIRNWKLTPLDDTLSSDFRVNWDAAQLLQMNSGKIRIKLPNAYHDPSGSVLKNLIVDFQRHHQEMIRINQMTNFVLLAQILEDGGERVVCLFSFEVAGKR